MNLGKKLLDCVLCMNDILQDFYVFGNPGIAKLCPEA
jgi:hypothetical protein